MNSRLRQGTIVGAFPRRSSIVDKKLGRLVELKPPLGLGWTSDVSIYRNRALIWVIPSSA